MPVLGIDIGGTTLKAGIVDYQGHISGKSNILVSELRNGNVIDNILQWVEPILENHNPASVGMAIPGLMSKSKTIIKEIPNLPEIEGEKFIKSLQFTFPEKKFYFANDANAAAWGTYKFCDEVETDTFGYITMGTGIGSAVVLNGKMYEGGGGSGPELGMIYLDNNKTIDETSAKNGMLNICRKLHSAYAKTTIINPNNLTPEKLFIAANQKDMLALKTFEKLGNNLGQALAIFIMLFDISTIYIGGGISPSFKFLKESMLKRLNEDLTDYFLDNLIIKEASLGNDAGILGAAALCF